MMRIFEIVGPLAFALALTSPASASKTFPEALRSQLGLEAIAGSEPGCQLCHQDDVGGLKTASKPLGRSLLKVGAVGGSVSSLRGALDTLERDGTDSDRDGTPDITELRDGTDPNVAPAVDGMPAPLDDIPLPETGCALGAAPQLSGALPAVGVALLLLLARRRRSA